MKKSFLFTTLLVLILNKTSYSALSWEEIAIPMSDGQSLAADVYLPDGWTSGPTILIQTPYWKDLYHFVGLPLGIFYNQENMGYAIVIVDWRGFYGSSDAAYQGSPTRGEDGYDVVEWIAAQTWSDGKVGTWGPSALGRVQFLTAREHPPHLVCMAPQVAAPYYQYQEYYTNGAARTEFLEQTDALGFGTSPIIYANPYYNIAWTFSENSNAYIDEIDIPTFMAGGWYDHNVEVMIQAFQELQNISATQVQDQHKLLMGPWVHGGSGTAIVGSSLQGELEYPGAEGWSDSLAFEFFDFHMKGIQNGWDQTPQVQYFQMGDDIWQQSDQWPVQGMQDNRLYFQPDMSMQTTLPDDITDVGFSYDPTDPSPTIGGPTLRTDLDQGPLDQTDLVESRNDILMFSSGILTSDVVVKGRVKTHLTVSTDVPDTDIAVRLCDVYPDGRSMLVAHSIYRLRFLQGFEQTDEAFLEPGIDYPVEILFPNTAITFKAGHQIRIDVTGSNYPAFNRNMNTGGEMYPDGNGDTLVNPQIAHNTLKFSTTADNGSYVVLPMTGDFPSLVSEKLVSPELFIFPNPSANNLGVISNGGVLKILDAGGRVVMETKINSGKVFTDIGSLTSGTYTVTLESEGSVVSASQLIKE